MINKISFYRDTTSFSGNIKLASNNTLARLHYINFLKAEDKFFKTSEVYERQTKDLSLKTILTFGKAVKNLTKMAYERALSAYYFNKK
jgi:hypothetical protein